MALYVVDICYSNKAVIAKNKKEAVRKLVEFIADGRLKGKCNVKRIPKDKPI